MTSLSAVDCPSPRHTERRGDGRVRYLILHYTDLATVEDSLACLAGESGEVSCHYLIDSDGTLYGIVPEDRRAWHAGQSYWAGERDLNSHSIGIELQYRPGVDGDYPPFPAVQIETLIPLAKTIMARHGIPPSGVLGHSDIAPDRKLDPGPAFPWDQLAAEGVGVWPVPDAQDRGTDPADVNGLLCAIGYDPEAGKAVAAFQRRFRPLRIDNRPDSETAALARAYLRMIETGGLERE